MVPQIIDYAKFLRSGALGTPGRVLEIGAMDINGTVRDAFRDCMDYVAIDMLPGKGVDRVLHSGACLSTFGPESFDTILACEVLEHDMMFWRTVEDMRRMLKRGGCLLITTPTYGFPYHGYPKDYYRYSMDSYRDVFFVDMDLLDLRFLTPDETIIGGIGRKR